MARKTTKKARPRSRKADDPRELACKFSNVNVGPERVAIGVKVDRGRIKLDEIDALVCGATLEAKLIYDPAGQGDVVGQTKLMNTEELSVASVAECPSLSVRTKEFGFRLSFSTNEADVSRLCQLAQQEGRVTLRRVGDSGSAPGGDDGDDSADDE